MARARRRPRRRRRSPTPRPPVTVTPPDGDQRLLDLARELAQIPIRSPSPVAALATAIEHLAQAWRPDAPLAAAVFDAWRLARQDGGRALSLAFAREQVTLGLHEILEAARQAGQVRADVGPDTLAWLVVAGCESLAHGGEST